jgi:hypothetical protein
VKLTVGNRLLDAEFDIANNPDSGALELTLESRGPGRNPDYTHSLCVLLRALCDAEATITSIEVASQRTKAMGFPKRQLKLRYPMNLGPKTNFLQLKNQIGDQQRRIGSDAKTRGGGNRTRRLRILCNSKTGDNRALKASLLDASSSIRRRAFVMLWNPEHWPIDEYVAELDEFRQGSLGQWSTGARQSGIFDGDLVLLLQVGRGGKGLIGYGIAYTPNERGVECVFTGAHWGKKRTQTNYVNVRWNQLVHPDDRLSADHFVGQFPQVAWSHLQGSGTQIPTDIAVSITDQFQKHVGSQSLESPEVADARAEIDILAGRLPKTSSTRRPRPRAVRLTAEQRRCIELRAMSIAKSHLRKQGWTTIVDTSEGSPFDYYCKRANAELWVEVKGTTSNGSSVVLTRNEVKHHRSVHPRSSLIVVHGIRLTGAGRSKAIEGTVFEIYPWQIHETDLDAIGFEYTTGL